MPLCCPLYLFFLLCVHVFLTSLCYSVVLERVICFDKRWLTFGLLVVQFGMHFLLWEGFVSTFKCMVAVLAMYPFVAV